MENKNDNNLEQDCCSISGECDCNNIYQKSLSEDYIEITDDGVVFVNENVNGSDNEIEIVNGSDNEIEIEIENETDNENINEFNVSLSDYSDETQYSDAVFINSNIADYSEENFEFPLSERPFSPTNITYGFNENYSEDQERFISKRTRTNPFNIIPDQEMVNINHEEDVPEILSDECFVCYSEDSLRKSCYNCNMLVCSNCINNLIHQFGNICVVCKKQFPTVSYPYVFDFFTERLFVHGVLDCVYAPVDGAYDGKFYNVKLPFVGRATILKNMFYRKGQFIYNIYNFPFYFLEGFEILGLESTSKIKTIISEIDINLDLPVFCKTKDATYKILSNTLVTFSKDYELNNFRHEYYVTNMNKYIKNDMAFLLRNEREQYRCCSIL